MLVTALPTIAVMIGANRVVRGMAITNPTGDPTLSAADELALRRTIVGRAVQMMETDVPQGSVWEVKGD